MVWNHWTNLIDMGGFMGLSRQRRCCPRSGSLVGYLRSAVGCCLLLSSPALCVLSGGPPCCAVAKSAPRSAVGFWVATALGRTEQTFGWLCKGLGAHLHSASVCERPLSGWRLCAKTFVPRCVFSFVVRVGGQRVGRSTILSCSKTPLLAPKTTGVSKETLAHA